MGSVDSPPAAARGLGFLVQAYGVHQRFRAQAEQVRQGHDSSHTHDNTALPITRHSISGSVDAAYAVYISRSFYVRVSHQPRVVSLSWVAVERTEFGEFYTRWVQGQDLPPCGPGRLVGCRRTPLARLAVAIT